MFLSNAAVMQLKCVDTLLSHVLHSFKYHASRRY